MLNLWYSFTNYITNLWVTFILMSGWDFVQFLIKARARNNTVRLFQIQWHLFCSFKNIFFVYTGYVLNCSKSCLSLTTVIKITFHNCHPTSFVKILDLFLLWKAKLHFLGVVNLKDNRSHDMYIIMYNKKRADHFGRTTDFWVSFQPFDWPP